MGPVVFQIEPERGRLQVEREVGGGGGLTCWTGGSAGIVAAPTVDGL